MKKRREPQPHPHSLAAGIILRKVAPGRLPSSEEEMRELAGSLWRDRRLSDDVLDLKATAKAAGPFDTRQVSALFWRLRSGRKSSRCFATCK